MALKYYAGDRVTGTNSDRTGLTTTNVLAGTQFLETDTNDIYHWDGSSWDLVAGDTVAQTLTNKTLTSPTIGTSLIIGEDTTIIFEGATANANETTLTVVDPTGDRVVSLPNATDTLVGKATTDTFTNKTIVHASGGNSITGLVNASIANSAAIANSKLAGPAISVTDGSNSTNIAPGAALTFAATSNETTVVNSSGTVTVGIVTNPTLSGNVSITGNLTVSGDTITANVGETLIEDSLLSLATANSANSIDIGWYGKYVSSGTKYAGMFWDAGTGKFYPRTAMTSVPSSTWSGGSVATIVANIEGAITGTSGTFSTTLGVTGNATFSGNVSLGDSDYLYIGASNDLQIYHDASNSYIAETGTGILRLLSNQIHLRNGADDEVLLSASQNGSVDLYYDNAKKFETTAAGATVTGKATIDSDGAKLFIKGGVGSTNPAGIAWTFNTADTEYAYIHLDYDLRGTAGEGLKMRSANGYMMTFDAGNDMAFQTDDVTRMTITNGGSINFGVDGNGVDVTFYGDTSGRDLTWDQSDNRLEFKDQAYMSFGDSNDFQIFHNGSNTYFDENGTGALIMRTNILSLRNAADDEQMIYAGEGNQIDLYHNGSKKFETTAAGATITGALTTTDGIRWGNGGSYGAGGIYSDSNWGAILTAFTASPAAADWLFEDAAGNDLVRIQRNSGGAIAMAVGGVSNTDWANGWSAFHLGDKTTLAGYPDNGFFLTDNARYNGTDWKLIEADVASQFAVTNGRLQFRQGATGSADAAVTWTYPLTISASTGHLGINNQNPIPKLHVMANATTGTVPYPLLALELADGGADTAVGEGPAINFYIPDSTTDSTGSGTIYARKGAGLSHLAGQIATVRISTTDALGSGDMVFSTALNAAALVEAMRISSAGNVTVAGNLQIAADGYIAFGDTNHLIDVNTGYMLFKMPTNEDFYWQQGSTNMMHLDTSAATLHVGSHDTINGLINITGGAAGNAEGGELRLFTAADYDSTYDYYFFDAYQDDLRIGRAGNVDITLSSTGAVTIPGGVDKIRAAADNTNADQYVAFLDNAATGAQQVLYDTSLTYNPVTNGLKTAGYFSVATSKGIYLDGGSDTYIRESGNFNEIDFYCGGAIDFRMQNDGDFHAEGDIYAFSTAIASDIALKKNITVIDNALDKVSQLKGVSFDWKREGKGSSAGLIAQDVERVLPELVTDVTDLKDESSSFKGLNYNGIIGLLVESIKELKEELSELKKNAS